MALAQFIEFTDIPKTANPSDPLPCKEYQDKLVQVYGTFTATAQLQGRMPGAGWQNIGAAVTAPGLISAPATLSELRIDLTAYTDGTVQAKMGGFREHGGSG
jgi:hypothetical protein